MKLIFILSFLLSIRAKFVTTGDVFYCIESDWWLHFTAVGTTEFYCVSLDPWSGYVTRFHCMMKCCLKLMTSDWHFPLLVQVLIIRSNCWVRCYLGTLFVQVTCAYYFINSLIVHTAMCSAVMFVANSIPIQQFNVNFTVV